MAIESPESGKKFDLISADLAELSQVLHSKWAEERPVFRLWLFGEDLSVFEADFFDEREALKVAGILARKLTMFSALPAPVLKFKEHYSQAVKGGDAYLKYALGQQHERLARLDASIPKSVDIDRQLRSVRRGIKRVLSDIDSYSNEDEMEDMLDKRIKSGPLRKQYLDHLRLGLRDLFELMHADYISGLVDDISMKVNERITEAFYKSLDLDELKIDLECRQVIRMRIDELLGSTLNELQKLGGLAVNRYKTDVQRVPFGREPTSQVCGIKRKSQPVAVAEEVVGGDVSKKGFDTMEVTKAKLKAAIRLAEGNGKLKVLLPPQGKLRARFEPQWKEMLRKLGYAGAIEFVVYEDLQRSNDKYTPILTFKGLNTHKNLWGQTAFENVFVIEVTPLLFLNSLKSSGASE